MSGAEAVHAASEAMWARMVEIAEQSHELVVSGQAAASVDSAARIAALVGDLQTLARAVIVLAQGDGDDAA